MLTLYDDAGKPTYAVLVGLTTQTASLRAGGVTQSVGLIALANLWRGEFATFWRVPPGYQARVSTGQAGPSAEWIARYLAQANGETPPTGEQRFDAALARIQLPSGKG